MTQFLKRTVFVLDVPMASDAFILRPEHTILRFQLQTTMDVGALCYLRRQSTKDQGPRKAIEGRKVDLSSLCPKRVGRIRAFIVFISEQIRHGVMRPSTAHKYAQDFSRFMTWGDENGHSNLLEDVDATRSAIIAYVEYINQKVRSHSISVDYGAVAQRQAVAILGEFLQIENLGRGINLLRKETTGNPTIPPHADAQGRTLALCEVIFKGLADLVLESKPYPFAISMPSYLNFVNNQMWIMPSTKWCMSSRMISVNGSFGSFNYREGRLNTVEESLLGERYVGKRNRVYEMHKAARRLLDFANKDSRHWHRKFMGIMALNAFIPMFLARTGMNWEQVVGLKWSGLERDNVVNIRQKFRSIKHRARGKEVYYQLPLQFMPLFRRFLQLREWLLEDHLDFDRLFFNMGNRSIGKPTSLRSSFQVMSQFLYRIDPDLSTISPRAWRAAKSDWLITKTDVSTAAHVLQNSERTVRVSYAAGAVEVQKEEMSNFLDGLILSSSIDLANVQIIATGQCSSFGSPSVIQSAISVASPNCDKPEIGCLFCDKFKVHADEVDVRKLLSCRYCLLRTSHLSGFYEQSKHLVERIQIILDEIGRRDPSLVQRITQEVNEGELDPYWAVKYDMLLRLKLLNESE